MKNLLFFFALALIIPSLAFANEHQTEGIENHHFHHNHIALFTGATSNLDHKVTDFSLGLDYEHRFDFFNNMFGIGIFGEIVFAEHSEILAGLPIFIHPIGNFKMLIAPSIISYEEEENTEGTLFIRKTNHEKLLADENTNTTQHNDFLLRVGFAYDFHAGSYSFTPTFNIDIHSGKFSLVYGIALGYGF